MSRRVPAALMSGEQLWASIGLELISDGRELTFFS